MSRYVIATILQPRLSLAERACIIERWISIAQVSLITATTTVYLLSWDSANYSVIILFLDVPNPLEKLLDCLLFIFVYLFTSFSGTTTIEEFFISEIDHFRPSVNFNLSSAPNVDVSQQVSFKKFFITEFAYSKHKPTKYSFDSFNSQVSARLHLACNAWFAFV